MKRPIVIAAAALAVLALSSSCKKTPPANVAARVNNRAITYGELDKIQQSQPQPPEGSSEDQALSQKLELLNSLINSEIMWQRAEKLGLTAVDADVETEFNKMKAPYTKEEFDRQLSARKLTVEDLRSQLRRDLTIQKLINKEITSLITITDADVANFYNANKASFNLAEPQVHLAQIMVTPFADPNVRNLKNSKAKTDAEARQKILEIEKRIRQGGPENDFSMLAQNYSEDPNSAPNGGDMGFVPESALEKANPELRKMVSSLQPGGVSPVIRTQEGYRILRVISKEPAGQRELNDPRVQQNIRETLLNRKDQLLKAAYYEVARNGAKVENFLARRIVENSGKPAAK